VYWHRDGDSRARSLDGVSDLADKSQAEASSDCSEPPSLESRVFDLGDIRRRRDSGTWGIFAKSERNYGGSVSRITLSIAGDRYICANADFRP
jgi:hypothetical protein